MLKKMIICSLCLFITVMGYSQDDIEEKESRTFIFTVLGGGNFAQIDGDSLAGYHKPGFNVGGRVQIVVHKNFQPSIEIAYSQKGSSSTFFKKPEILFVLDYAQIPVMLNYVDRRVMFSAGMAYAQLIRSKVTIRGNDEPAILDQYKKSDISFIAGATFFMTKNLGVNLRWERSVANLLKAPAQGIDSQVNKLITLRAAWKF